MIFLKKYFLYLKDYHGGWDRILGANAPLYGHPSQGNALYHIDHTLNRWINGGFKAENVILGLGTYGRSMTMISQINHALGSASSGAGTAGPVNIILYINLISINNVIISYL
jgi:GH18 family chitinase